MVTNSCDGFKNIAEMYLFVVPLQLGTMGGVVNTKLYNPGNLTYMTLVQPDAGCTNDTLQNQ